MWGNMWSMVRPHLPPYPDPNKSRAPPTSKKIDLGGAIEMLIKPE